MQSEPEAALFERGLALFRKHYGAAVADLSCPYPGWSRPERLARAGFQLACITNKAEAFTLPLLRQLSTCTSISCWCSGDSLPKQKPDPAAHARLVSTSLASPPITVCAGGDSSNDVQHGARRRHACHLRDLWLCTAPRYPRVAPRRRGESLTDVAREARHLLELFSKPCATTNPATSSRTSPIATPACKTRQKEKSNPDRLLSKQRNR